MRTNIISKQGMKKIMTKPTQKQVEDFHKKNTEVFHAAAGVANEALAPKSNVGREFIQKKKDAEFIKIADRKLKNFKFGVGVGK